MLQYFRFDVFQDDLLYLKKGTNDPLKTCYEIKLTEMIFNNQLFLVQSHKCESSVSNAYATFKILRGAVTF